MGVCRTSAIKGPTYNVNWIYIGWFKKATSRQPTASLRQYMALGEWVTYDWRAINSTRCFLQYSVYLALFEMVKRITRK